MTAKVLNRRTHYLKSLEKRNVDLLNVLDININKMDMKHKRDLVFDILSVTLYVNRKLNLIETDGIDHTLFSIIQFCMNDNIYNLPNKDNETELNIYIKEYFHFLYNLEKFYLSYNVLFDLKELHWLISFKNDYSYLYKE